MTALIQLDIVYHPPETDESSSEPSVSEDVAVAQVIADASANIPVEDDSERFEAAATWIAQHLQLGGMTVSVSLVDDATIRELNRDELGHDWATDVISFVFETEKRSGSTFVDGEVIASYDTARRLAADAGWSIADELLLYVIHGMLHIGGLDDIDADDRQRMRSAEQACLEALGVPGASEHLARWERISYES